MGMQPRAASCLSVVFDTWLAALEPVPTSLVAGVAARFAGVTRRAECVKGLLEVLHAEEVVGREAAVEAAVAKLLQQDHFEFRTDSREDELVRRVALMQQEDLDGYRAALGAAEERIMAERAEEVGGRVGWWRVFGRWPCLLPAWRLDRGPYVLLAGRGDCQHQLQRTAWLAGWLAGCMVC
jgi:hypothetical protein